VLHLLHLLHLLLLLQLLLALILGDHRELLREEDGPSVAEAVARELLVRAVELLGVLGAPRVVVRRVGRVRRTKPQQQKPYPEVRTSLSVKKTSKSHFRNVSIFMVQTLTRWNIM